MGTIQMQQPPQQAFQQQQQQPLPQAQPQPQQMAQAVVQQQSMQMQSQGMALQTVNPSQIATPRMVEQETVSPLGKE